MESQDIIILKQKLQNYKETGAKTCRAILQNLLNANLTVQNIKETKISQTVKTLSDIVIANPDEDQQKMIEIASQLIVIWKKMFSKPKQTASLSNISRNNSSGPLQLKKSVSTTSQDSSLKPNSQTSQQQIVIPQNLDYGQLKIYATRYRTKPLRRLFEILMMSDCQQNKKQQESSNDDLDLEFLDEQDNNDPHLQEKAATLANEIEAEILKKMEINAKKHHSYNLLERNYMSAMKTLFKHLTNQSHIRKGILDQSFTPQQIADMDENIFLSEEEREKIQKQKEQQKILQNPEFWAMKKKEFMKTCTEGERCRFCKKNTAYCESEKQTRSADEPMTRFMRCDNCDRNWRD